MEAGVLTSSEFNWADYTVLAAMLIISSSIGLFYGWFSPAAKTGQDFLLAGGTMSTLPTALSLAAGFITAIELLGNPSEMYFHGNQFWMICISFIIVGFISSYLFLPVFMELQLTSSYEYLEIRFHRYIRYLGSFLYLVQMTLYTSVAVFAPALALSHVTGLSVYLAVAIVYVVCIFYASQGGMKAVIIADTFQASLLMIAILAVMFLGNNLAGGFNKILKDSLESQRMELFDFNFDITERHTFWSVVIGGTFYWTTMFCSNQSTIQKYLSVSTLSQARKALWTSCIGLVLIFTINFYTGMIIFSEFKTCDPYSEGQILSQDEILPFYVMKSLGSYIGLPGLFVSGIFAASLGTVACAINSLAAVSMTDIMIGFFSMKIPDDKAPMISKWLSVLFGIVSFALVFIVESLGSVLQIALSFNGITGGITLGLFALGMIFPWSNTKGAVVGSLTSLAVVATLATGSQIYNASTPLKPLSIDTCNANITHQAVNFNESEIEEIWWGWRVSYLWYSMIGCLGTFVLGSLVSLVTCPQNPTDVDSKLLSPPIISLLNTLGYGSGKKTTITEKSSGDIVINIDSKDSKDEMKGIENFALNIEPEDEA